MINSKDKSTILKDVAVFEYVADQQSDGAKENFEQALENDPSLQADVLIERHLREQLSAQNDAQDQIEPISMSNFDELIARIDAAEQQNELEQSVSRDLCTDTSAASNNDAQIIRPARFGLSNMGLSIAASLAVFGIIGAVFFTQLTEPEFQTLSDPQASASIDFASLVEQGRLAKLQFATTLDSSEVSQFFDSYSLNSISTAGALNAFIVSADQTINKALLATWQADERVSKVELVSFDGDK